MRASPRRRSFTQAVRWVTAACSLAVIGFATRPAQAEEPTGPATAYRPDEYPPTSARYAALIAGGAVLAGSYGVGFGTSYLWPSAPNAEQLRIPVAGPWMALANAGCGRSEGGCETIVVVFRSVFATLSGIGQAGGVLLLSEALFLPSAPTPARGASAPLVPNASLKQALGLPPPADQLKLSAPQLSLAHPESASLSVVPFATDAGLGFGLSGSF